MARYVYLECAADGVLERLRVSALDILSDNFLAISEIFVMLNII